MANDKINVRDLSRGHLYPPVTIMTRNIVATGVLQRFRHVTEAINGSNYNGDNWVNRLTATAIAILPNQRMPK